jgi:hypothetical protein
MPAAYKSTMLSVAVRALEHLTWMGRSTCRFEQWIGSQSHKRDTKLCSMRSGLHDAKSRRDCSDCSQRNDIRLTGVSNHTRSRESFERARASHFVAYADFLRSCVSSALASPVNPTASSLTFLPVSP